MDARVISYLEAHGTGTKIGDPIEITGASKAYQKYTKDKQYCAIGSVKSNIGHTEPVAGIAGLAKVLLQMKYKQLVPSLHTDTLNPDIEFGQTPFRVQQELTEWKRPVLEGREHPRIAGISSFGAGGANAHVVIEEYNGQGSETYQSKGVIGDLPGQRHDQKSDPEEPVLIVLSAKSEDRLKEVGKNLLGYLTRNKKSEDHNIRGMAYTLQVGRESMERRVAFIAHNEETLIDALDTWGGGEKELEGFYEGVATKKQAVTEALGGNGYLQDASKRWMANRELGKLADIWVNGIHLDWGRLYGEEKPKRISLPVYPFAQDRYPVPDSHTEKYTQREEVYSDLQPNNETSPSETSDCRQELKILARRWKASPLTPCTRHDKGIVLLWGSATLRSLAKSLFDAYPNIKPVIFCQHDQFKRVDENEYELDFYTEDQGLEAYREFGRRYADRLLGCIDLTALDMHYDFPREIEEGKLALFQKFIEHHRDAGLKWMQVTFALQGHKTATTHLSGAKLLGLYRMIEAEYQDVCSKLVDTDIPLVNETELKDCLLQEWFSSKAEPECCYREGKRYVPCLATVKTDQDIKRALDDKRSYSPESVFVISGGTRGIGSAIASHVVAQGARKLVIMGKEILPERSQWSARIQEQSSPPSLRQKLQAIQNLEGQSVQVNYIRGA